MVYIFIMSIKLEFCLGVLLTLLIVEIKHSFQECVLSLQKDLPKQHGPLYFIQNGKRLDLLMPHMIEDGIMTLRDGQRLVLACPGKNNQLTMTGTEATLSKCAGGIMLDIENRQFPTYQLECTSPVQSTVHITNKECGVGEGREVRIGFQTPNGSILEETSWFNIWSIIVNLWRLIWPMKSTRQSTWVNLVTICHSLKKSESLYSTHVLYGKTLVGAEMKWTRPQFTIGNNKLYPGIKPDYFFKKQHQRNIFKKLLGKRPTNKYLLDNFLSRGHLSPDADFLFGSWQYTTYNYVNTAPQWFSINAGNWQNVERFVRNFAIKTGSNLLVVTGTYGILSLADFKEEYKKIYLHPEDKKISVPKYFWKVIHDPVKKACIAFVCTNNPFLSKEPPKLCEEICTKSGWPGYTDSLYKGYVYCCETNDLRNKIPTIPKLQCLSLLVGPKAFYNYRN